MAKRSVDDILLSRFFDNQCSEEERQVVLDWLADPRNRTLVQIAMRRHWNKLESADEQPAGIDVEYILKKTQEKIFSEPDARVINKAIKFPAPQKRKIFLWRMAAVWLGLIVLFISGLMLFSPHSDQPSFLTHQADNNVHVKTASGEIILKVLSDGSKVWLNAQSSITFPTSFSGHSNREVILQGEAFFDVAEDKDHPFIVSTPDINIRVLGTAFNVKSYAGDPTVETTLIRGKVVIENKRSDTREETKLKPNQQAVFSHSSEKITLAEVRVEKHTSWNSGSLVFEEENLYDVIRSLERWYGVKIYLQHKSDLDCKLTARIDKESLGETLEILKSLTGIRYSIADKDVFIQGRICEN